MKNISFVILVVCSMALTCHCQVDFVGSFVNTIFGLHSWDSGKQVPFLEVKCYPSYKGRISSFKWKWDAKLECTGRFTGIVGTGSGSAKDSSMKRAIDNLIRKALEKGVLKMYELDTFGGVVIG